MFAMCCDYANTTKKKLGYIRLDSCKFLKLNYVKLDIMLHKNHNRKACSHKQGQCIVGFFLELFTGSQCMETGRLLSQAL